MSRIFKVEGFALISALVVLALVTSVTVAMAVSQTQGIEMATNIIRTDQLKHHGDAVLLWANGSLIDDLEQTSIDSTNDNWNIALVDVEIPGGKVDAFIVDLQGNFNLNNLALTEEQGELARSRFQRLLKILSIEADITSAIADWIDSDTEVRFPDGAEDDYYLSLEKPYRTGNQAFVSVSEMLLVKNVSRDVFMKLQPYVSALPIGTNININTAPPEILLSLSEKMDASAVEAMLNMRAQKPFTTIANESNGSGSDTNANESTSQNTTDTQSNSAAENTPSPNNWTWTALKELNERLAREKATANEANNNAKEVEESQQQPLSEAGLDDYEIDMTGLTVSSSYFRVSGQAQQYEKIFNVDYKLYRDGIEKKLELVSRQYNGMAYE